MCLQFQSYKHVSQTYSNTDDSDRQVRGAEACRCVSASPPLCSDYRSRSPPRTRFSLGGALPIGRRFELLRLAQERESLIAEDDYDGEIRYPGALTPAARGSQLLYAFNAS